MENINHRTRRLIEDIIFATMPEGSDGDGVMRGGKSEAVKHYQKTII